VWQHPVPLWLEAESTAGPFLEQQTPSSASWAGIGVFGGVRASPSPTLFLEASLKETVRWTSQLFSLRSSS
jgi:hypothetical protein